MIVTSQRVISIIRVKSLITWTTNTNTVVSCYSFVLKPWLGHTGKPVLGVGLGGLDNPMTPVDGTTSPLVLESNVEGKFCILLDVTITGSLGLLLLLLFGSFIPRLLSFPCLCPQNCPNGPVGT